MDIIEWSDKFSVGLNLIDEQHKRLIDIINVMIENSHSEFDKEIISKTLHELVEYAIYHFNDEEKLMMENSYPDYEDHKEMHDEFKIKIVSYHSGNVNIENIGTTILEYLRSWLIGHILQEDMKYKIFFDEKGLLDYE